MVDSDRMNDPGIEKRTDCTPSFEVGAEEGLGGWDSKGEGVDLDGFGSESISSEGRACVWLVIDGGSEADEGSDPREGEEGLELRLVGGVLEGREGRRRGGDGRLA